VRGFHLLHDHVAELLDGAAVAQGVGDVGLLDVLGVLLAQREDGVAADDFRVFLGHGFHVFLHNGDRGSGRGRGR